MSERLHYQPSSIYPNFGLFLIELEPNVGIVNVPDKRLDVLGEIHNSVKVIPAAVSAPLVVCSRTSDIVMSSMHLQSFFIAIIEDVAH